MQEYLDSPHSTVLLNTHMDDSHLPLRSTDKISVMVSGGGDGDDDDDNNDDSLIQCIFQSYALRVVHIFVRVLTIYVYCNQCKYFVYGKSSAHSK